jgi:hypothetical protein
MQRPVNDLQLSALQQYESRTKHVFYVVWSLYNEYVYLL